MMGQNMYYITEWSVDYTSVVDVWYDDDTNPYEYSSHYCAAPPVVLAKAAELGCGANTCSSDGRTYVVCNYREA